MRAKHPTADVLTSKRSPARRGLKTAWLVFSGACVLYTLAHVADAVYYWSYTPLSARVFQDETSFTETLQIEPERAALATSIAEILRQDRVPQADLWAAAVTRHLPVNDAGYAALVMAQIRRESHFNSPDLEWLYDHVVPDLLHDSGVVANHVNTVGPMQINRNQLLRLMKRNGEDVDYPAGPAFTRLVTGIDKGVGYAVQYLDKLVGDYIPSRRIGGWSDHVGHRGFGLAHEANQPVVADDPAFRMRQRIAAYQKMVSDLSGSPLVLDGVAGRNTLRATKRLALGWPESAKTEMLAALDESGELNEGCFELVATQWQSVFGAEARRAIFPRISHDPRLVFILADFNAGRGACRIAALQHMLNVLHDAEIDVDGKYGPKTLAAIRAFVSEAPMTEKKRQDFLALIDSQRKLTWMRQMIVARLTDAWRLRFGEEPASALCPEIWTEHFNQQKRRVQRLSTWEYVSASTRFFEDYHLRLLDRLKHRQD